MDTKNNSDGENTFPIDFQPMPKRFMVWDKVDKNFVDNPSKACAITPFGALISQSDMIVCQSTNLFDKDGQEIFEGSIMAWGSDTGVVELYKGKWTFHVVSGHFDVYHELYPNADMVKAIGHILSNPELLEEK